MTDGTESPDRREHPQHDPDVQKLRTVEGVRQINWAFDSQYKVEFEAEERSSDVQDRFIEIAKQHGFKEVGGPASRKRDSLLIRRDR